MRQVGLAEADDEVVRAYAADHGLAVVTKDGDFNSLAFLHGAPPKIIWLRLGNYSTSDIERILRSNRSALEHFVGDPTASVLVLVGGASAKRQKLVSRLRALGFRLRAASALGLSGSRALGSGSLRSLAIGHGL